MVQKLALIGLLIGAWMAQAEASGPQVLDSLRRGPAAEAHYKNFRELEALMKQKNALHALLQAERGSGKDQAVLRRIGILNEQIRALENELSFSESVKKDAVAERRVPSKDRQIP